ncbi:hypothetical protein CgunFtcFv8_013646 [Champsocephalus gunnari]|nr:hypothetical protein CgunFtcFv8_013646 [Champsocephalus gunnari]
MIQTGFGTVRDRRPSQADSNRTNEKARRDLMKTAIEMTSQQNGSSHQETTVNGKAADHPTNMGPAALRSVGGPAETALSGDQVLGGPSLDDTTVHLADRPAADHQQENI